MGLDLTADEFLVGRTLGRITPVHKEGQPSTISIAFTSGDMYILTPKEGEFFRDLWINTMHKAEPITYARQYYENHQWIFEFGCRTHAMCKLIFSKYYGYVTTPFLIEAVDRG